MRYLLLILIFWGLSNIVNAHGGGLNSQGCHNNRKTGDYHCHRSNKRIPSSDKKSKINGAYRNCAAVRAAGAAPVYSGQPGYGIHLDRDRDGIGCE